MIFKKNIIRYIATSLLFAMMISLAGCGTNTSSSTAASPSGDAVPGTAIAQEVTSQTEGELDGASSETADAQPTVEPTEANDLPTSTPAPTPSTTPTQKPTLEPTPAPTSSPALPPTPAPSPTPTPTPAPTPAPTPTLSEPANDPEDEPVGLSSTQRNSINMLNYMTVLTQQINEAKGNRYFLESAYSTLENDLYPNAVDMKTQGRIKSLMDTIDKYRMIAVKRDRLEYIYEQNKAQALRQAIPNPLGLLSAVQSGSLLKAAVSALYMTVDSVSSYKSATSQADLQFLKDGWELDDAESAELHNSTTDALNYMLNMVRDYDLPGDYALNRESVEDFLAWSSKPDSQIVRKITWLESHKEIYKEFGLYWLELAKDYYNSEEYEKCLYAVQQYESVSTRILRKDIDYATVLPMAIISAKGTMSTSEYITTAEQYCASILSNTKDSDWSLRYYAAQIYMDLYSLTKNDTYLDKAYQIAYDNVNNLVNAQLELNAAYLADVQEVKADKDATKREKAEIKKYNKLIKDERKIALPPVSEALYLNCDLLFALAEKRNITTAEQSRIESILHENGESLFLTKALDARFWFGEKATPIDANDIDVVFDGKKLTISAACVTDRSKITVTVSGDNGTIIIDDWTVDEVKRPKNGECADFLVSYSSEAGKKYDYKAGDIVNIRVIPVEETPNESIVFTHNVIAIKNLWVLNGISFERVTK